MANVSPYSFYHYWSFPRGARQCFEKYALFQEAPENIVTRWKDTYEHILRKATFRARGRRLVLKNPVNTGRIALLLELFPDAQFIHVYRNPYVVFSSTRYFYHKMLSLVYLQTIQDREIEANILLFYAAMMQKFWREKSLIPPGNLVEVKFEDLEADPLAETRRIYASLGLSGFAAAEPHFQMYAASQRDYRKNSFPLNQEIIGTVNRHWKFALENWGYRPQ